MFFFVARFWAFWQDILGLQVEGTGLECYGFTKESGSKDQIVLTRNPMFPILVFDCNIGLKFNS